MLPRVRRLRARSTSLRGTHDPAPASRSVPAPLSAVSDKACRDQRRVRVVGQHISTRGNVAAK